MKKRTLITTEKREVWVIRRPNTVSTDPDDETLREPATVKTVVETEQTEAPKQDTPAADSDTH